MGMFDKGLEPINKNKGKGKDKIVEESNSSTREDNEVVITPPSFEVEAEKPSKPEKVADNTDVKVDKKKKKNTKVDEKRGRPARNKEFGKVKESGNFGRIAANIPIVYKNKLLEIEGNNFNQTDFVIDIVKFYNDTYDEIGEFLDGAGCSNVFEYIKKCVDRDLKNNKDKYIKIHKDFNS